MKTKILRCSILFFCFFVGIGAIAGGLTMLVGRGDLLGEAYLLPLIQQKLPFRDLFFQDFFFAGNVLFVWNGVTQLFTAGLLYRRSPWGAAAAMACGLLLVLWTGIQFYVFPLNALTTLYFILGLLELLIGAGLRSSEKKQGKENLSC